MEQVTGEAVLVIGEMPEQCSDCILRESFLGIVHLCYAESKILEDKHKKPDWCPLRITK